MERTKGLSLRVNAMQWAVGRVTGRGEGLGVIQQGRENVLTLRKARLGRGKNPLVNVEGKDVFLRYWSRKKSRSTRRMKNNSV